jgi:hypothetical protein
MSWQPNVPVPAIDSAANVYTTDVIGQKGDDENQAAAAAALSLGSRTFRTDMHHHSACKIYPSLTAGVTVSTAAGAWAFGALTVVIPINTVVDSFDIHGVNFDDILNADVYELALFSGAAGATEVGRIRFTRTGTTAVAVEAPIQTPILSANSGVWAKLASAGGATHGAVISLRYHLY